MMCVCPIEAGRSKGQWVSGDSREVRKKEEVIDCTHKSGLLGVRLEQEDTVNSHEVEQKLADKDLEYLDLLKSGPLLCSVTSQARKKCSEKCGILAEARVHSRQLVAFGRCGRTVHK